MTEHTNNYEKSPEQGEGFISYKTLEIKLAKTKFYNDEKKFGFVTIIDPTTHKPLHDAYLSGLILDKAGIYDLKEGDLVNVRHVTKEKGEAVVYIQRYSPNKKETPVQYGQGKSDND